MARQTTIRTRTLRGANALLANVKRLESADGKRWATGRTVKAETSVPGIFEPVEVWALKERRDGKAISVGFHRSEEDARRWVGVL